MSCAHCGHVAQKTRPVLIVKQMVSQNRVGHASTNFQLCHVAKLLDSVKSLSGRG